jgi:hypothetical protein
MPSLLNTTVAANYGAMPAQDTYATGAAFSAFGTRPLRLLKVVLSSGSNNDLRYQDGQTAVATGYTQANSLFGQVVRAMQTNAEVYFVGQPDSTSFLALVAGDTVDDAATSSNVAGLTYGQLAATIKATIDNRTAAQHGAGAAGTATTVTITASGTAANPNFFVGASLGTFA